MSQQTQHGFGLGKDEILRGFEAYKRVFRNSRIAESKYLKLYYQKTDFRLSPQLMIRVGFTVSKKKLKGAVRRNRIKRLLKEAYRLNKHLLYARAGIVSMDIILTVNEKRGFEEMLKDGFRLFSGDIKNVFDKIT